MSVPTSSSRPPRRRRGRLTVSLLAVGVVVAVTVALFRLQGAGETTAALPTLTLMLTATGTAVVGSVPSPSATPLSADLAQQTVQQYWDLISRGNIGAAYDLLSTSAQAGITRQQFLENITHLLDATNGLTATAGIAVVTGDTAVVPVSLQFTNSGTTQSSQRVVWESGWRIDQTVSAATPTPTP